MKSFSVCLALLLPSFVIAGDWSQFRGPNASGIAPDNAPLPDKIGPNDNVVWKLPLPPGHSSPVIHGDRVYLTGVRDKNKLVTIGIDRNKGKILWESEARYKTLEKIHAIGSHAQSTCATDGEVIVSFFGSSGLYAYNAEGKELWFKPFGPFPNDFGAGSSPIIVGDKVILLQDHDNNSFLMAFDKKTGDVKWKVDRSEFPRSYATPVIWEQAGKKQIVVAGTLRAVGYDLDTGAEVWTVRGLARIINMTPTVGPDGNLYLAAWSPGSDPGERVDVTSFDETAKQHDKNKDGKFAENELPTGPIKQRFTQIDRDKDGFISKVEYDGIRKLFSEAQNRTVVIRPGGKGDITATHIVWSMDNGKYMPYVPSPIVYKDALFMVKNGGLLTSFDLKTGKPIKNERIFGSANYYASLVAGDGKIYTFSERGHVNVIRAQGEWDVISQSKFEEDSCSTPAIAGGRIYLRTNAHLYCFGLPEKK